MSTVNVLCEDDPYFYQACGINGGISLYSENIFSSDSITNLRNNRKIKSCGRAIFLHYRCLVMERYKSYLFFKIYSFCGFNKSIMEADR